MKLLGEHRFYVSCLGLLADDFLQSFCKMQDNCTHSCKSRVWWSMYKCNLFRFLANLNPILWIHDLLMLSLISQSFLKKASCVVTFSGKHISNISTKKCKVYLLKIQTYKAQLMVGDTNLDWLRMLDVSLTSKYFLGLGLSFSFLFFPYKNPYIFHSMGTPTVFNWQLSCLHLQTYNLVTYFTYLYWRTTKRLPEEQLVLLSAFH